MSRSFLFVPGDSERKLDKSLSSDADALILDLEDSVLPDAKGVARDRCARFVADHRGEACWVRINPLDTADALDDLKAVMPAGPFGIVLPKPGGARDAIQLAKLLEVLEHENGLVPGETLILPIATERPAALFHLHEYADATPRLGGLTWGAEDLATALGATANRDGNGNWLPIYETARTFCRLAAAAAGVAAIDTVFTDFRDARGLTRYAGAARRDGFEGMLAIHPAQVPLINAAFLPTEEEVGRAGRIVALFEHNRDAGVVAMDGEMIDRPHLEQAKRILESANKYQ